jgi:hypothetical protein
MLGMAATSSAATASREMERLRMPGFIPEH